jgi:hypothetical protein
LFKLNQSNQLIVLAATVNKLKIGEKMRSRTAVVCLMIFAALLGNCSRKMAVPPLTHPDTSKWQELFTPDLSNAVYADSVWTFQGGILTAAYDQNIWTKEIYENFILDLEFKTADSTNSGVVVYCSDTNDWIPNSIEIQIADDYSKKWSSMPKTWQCGAIFGHLPAVKSMVNGPGEWNRFTITCQDSMIWVMLNGLMVTTMNTKLWTSATQNPDGSEIPEWLNKPFAELPTRGYIGLQGKHAEAPIWFRNMKIKMLKP